MTLPSRVVCYGTAWVGQVGQSGEILPDPAPGLAALELWSPGLDASFLSSCYLQNYLLARGVTFRQLLAAGSRENLSKGNPRRITGSAPSSPLTFHVYECSEELCESLASLSAERIEAIARDWSRVHGVGGRSREEPGAIAHRERVLTRLAELASIAIARRVHLMLRVDYRARPWQALP